MLFGAKDILSLDLTSGDISAVLGKHNKKGVVVTDCLRLELPDGVYQDGQILEIDEFSRILSEFLSDNDIDQVETNTVINSTSIFMREAIFPKVSHQELEAIIGYQLHEFIPINPEDYVVKFLELGTVIDAGLEKTAVLLIGVPNSLVRSHLTLLSRVGLKPAVLDYEGNAIAKLVTNGGTVNQVVRKGDNVAAVNLGQKHTNLSIIENGVLRVSRYIDKGMDSVLLHLQEKFPDEDLEETRRRLFSLNSISAPLDPDSSDVEFARITREGLMEILERIGFVFRYHQTRENATELDQIFIYGTGSEIAGIDKVFKEVFERDSYILRSMENVKCDEDINLYANAIGGLIRLEEVRK